MRSATTGSSSTDRDGPRRRVSLRRAGRGGRGRRAGRATGRAAAGDPLLPVTRWRTARLPICGAGPPTGQGGQLAHPPRPRVGQSDLDALDPMAGAGHRLVRYDERGCGLSDWDVEEFSLDAWVEDLELVVDSADLDRFPLLGLSQGGAVAITYALRHPERVTQLVLVGAYSRGRLARARNDDEREEAALDLALARVSWRRDDAAFRQVFASQFLPDGTARALGGVQRPPARDHVDRQRRPLPRHLRPDRRRRHRARGHAARP